MSPLKKLPARGPFQEPPAAPPVTVFTAVTNTAAVVDDRIQISRQKEGNLNPVLLRSASEKMRSLGTPARNRHICQSPIEQWGVMPFVGVNDTATSPNAVAAMDTISVDGIAHYTSVKVTKDGVVTSVSPNGSGKYAPSDAAQPAVSSVSPVVSGKQSASLSSILSRLWNSSPVNKQTVIPR